MNFQKTSALVFIVTVLQLAGLGCSTSNNNPTPQVTSPPPSPANFISALQASDPSEAGSSIIEESAIDPGVLVIYDSALKSDMAVDLSAQHFANAGPYNLEFPENVFVPITTQDTINRYLQDTGGYARVVQPGTGNETGNYYDAEGNAYSQGQNTRDTDLQQADLQQASIASRAQAMADDLQMSVESATQLVTLADKVKKMSAVGSITPQDRDAITEASLNVAGLTTSDVNQAIAATIQTGRTDEIDALMAKAAGNLGMPSTDNLRTKLLPILGINIGPAK